MRILVFENEFAYLKTQFDYVNQVYFDDTIDFDVLPKSQDLKDYSTLDNYDFVFVDISLAIKSVLDGFGILKKIEELGIDHEKVRILTGNHQIEQGLKDKGLRTDYTVLTKPIDFNDLLKSLNYSE